MSEDIVTQLGAMAESVSIIYKTFIENGISEIEAVSLTAITMRYIFKPLDGNNI